MASTNGTNGTGAVRPGASSYGRPDPISTTTMQDETAADLWKRVARRFKRSRNRILAARDIEDGRGGLASPYAEDVSGSDQPDDPWAFLHPQRKMFPLDLTNALSDERPDIERRARGGSETERAKSESVEEYLRAALEDTLDYDAVYGKAVQDAEWALVSLPQTADYLEIPSWEDVQEAGDDPAPDAPSNPAKAWWRDADGKVTDDPKRRNREQTAAAYEDAYAAAIDRMASTFPVTHRIVSATDCVPLLQQGRGRRRYECVGLIVRTLFEEAELVGQGYRWPRMGNRLLLSQEYDPDATYGANGQIYLYEVYAYQWEDDPDAPGGHRRCPMVAYSVGGLDTRYRVGTKEAPRVINLWEEYGLDVLPVGYYWGLHLERDDPDARGIPILDPIASVLVAAESQVMASNAHTWQTAYNGHIIVPDEKIPQEVYIELGDNGEKRFKSYSLPNSGEVAVWPGEPKPLVPAQMSPDAHHMADRLLGMLEAALPDKAVLSGDQAARSGRSLSVASTLMKVGKRQIREGVRQCVEDAAEHTLRILYGLADKHGVPIPLYVPTDAAPDDPTAPTQQIVEFKRSWLGDRPVFGIRAYWPLVGNLAEVQQMGDLYSRGMASWDDLMETRGKVNPQLERAKIQLDKWFNSPEGTMDQMAAAWAWRGEAEKAKALELQVAGKLSPSGMPASAVAPEAAQAAANAAAPGQPPGAAPTQAPPPQPGGGQQMPGVAAPNIAAATLGSVVSAGMGGGQEVADQKAQIMAGQPGIAGRV